LPDRLFSDIARSYRSASQDVRGDVRELIPEFFSCPEFLENLSRLDFGISHSTGEKVDDVKLPSWAKDDPLLFVTLHRQVLESHYVSENLPVWIDLIRGWKQRDVESLNASHPLSYEGAIDLGSITDPLERETTTGIIHNFGQTPRKLFNSSHPSRNLSGTLSLPVKVKRGVCEDALALTRDPRPLKRFDSPVAHITIDSSGKAYPTPHRELLHPSRSDDGIRWDRDNEILQAFSRGIIAQAIESIYPTCATFADPDTLVTGSSDSIVRVWHVSYEQSSRGVLVLSLAHLLRGHSGPVSCIQASRTWSVAVSGSSDGSAVLWDLNRGSYVRSIWHAEGNISSQDASVNFVAINESTGYISTCSTRFLWLHTIAARPIAKLDLLLCDPTSQVSSIAFHEREYSQLGILAVGDGKGSVVLYTWNADGTPEGTKAQWEFVEVRRLLPNVDHLQPSRLFNSLALWVGDASGNVFRWAIPD
ncbi:BEACH domain-containing protein, partial [Pisolithus marmoratus]